MNEKDRLLDLADRAWSGPAWHGPSVREALEGVTAAQAAARPIGAAHTIWELVEHIGVWQDAVRRWIAGEEYTVPPERDFVTVTDTSEMAWRRTRDRLEAHRAAVRAALAAFPEERYVESRGGGKSPWFAVLHGVIHHDLYHAGQIALLRKSPPA